MFNIDNMTAAMPYGGARPNLFRVILTNPILGSNDQQVPYMGLATELPDFEMGVAIANYQGGEAKFSGNQKFKPWTISFYNDEDFGMRDPLERWRNSILDTNLNQNMTGSSSPLNYKSQGLVQQLGKNNAVIKEYKFIGVWPSSVGAVQLGWDQNDRIMTFDVTFQYDKFTTNTNIA